MKLKPCICINGKSLHRQVCDEELEVSFRRKVMSVEGVHAALDEDGVYVLLVDKSAIKATIRRLLHEA